MTEERFEEIRHNYENSCGVVYEYWDYARGYPPKKAHDAAAAEDMLELIDEVARLDGENEKLLNKLALHKLGKRNLDAMIEHKDAEIARLRKALEFYADEKSWQPNVVTMLTPIHYDYNGKLAREALQNDGN